MNDVLQMIAIANAAAMWDSIFNGSPLIAVGALFVMCCLARVATPLL